MPTKQVAASTLWQLGSQVTMAALSILTVKFVTMGLSKELVGNYNSAYGYLQLFGILADFGLYAVAVREVSRSDRREDVLGALIVIRMGILLLSLGTALLFVWLLPVWQGTPLPLSVTIAALVPFFTLLAGIVRTVFQVHYKMQYVFLAEVVQRIFTTGAIGFFVLQGIRSSTDLHNLHLFLFFGGVGAFILFFISMVYGNRLMKVRPNFDSVLIKNLLKKALPYGVAFLCVAAYRQFDITMIALLRPDFELQNAYYGTVLRMTDMGFLIPTFLLNSTLPILSERESKGEDTKALLGETMFILLLLGSISALFALLWARPLIQLLTTDAYLSTAMGPGSDTALAMMSAPLILNALVLYGFYVLLTKHLWKRLVITLICAALLSLLLNFIVIPIFGFVGAAFTSIVTHLVLALALLPQGLRAMPLKLPPQGFLRWGAFTILLAFGLIVIRPYLTHELATVSGLLIATVYMGALAVVLRIRNSVV